MMQEMTETTESPLTNNERGEMLVRRKMGRYVPEWVLLYYRGSSYQQHCSVIEEGEIFAITRIEGHHSPSGQGSPWLYGGLSFEIVRKESTFDRDTHGRTIHRGRAKKSDLEKFRRLLHKTEVDFLLSYLGEIGRIFDLMHVPDRWRDWKLPLLERAKWITENMERIEQKGDADG